MVGMYRGVYGCVMGCIVRYIGCRVCIGCFQGVWVWEGYVNRVVYRERNESCMVCLFP